MEPDAAPAGLEKRTPDPRAARGPPAGTMTCREELADGERYPLMKRISRRKRGPVPEDAVVARREAPALRQKRGTN